MSCLASTTSLPVHLPLSLEPLITLLYTSKKCLDDNFISSFLTVVGCIMVFHYESLLDIQDECPLILCYSRQSGTGIWKLDIFYLAMFELCLYACINILGKSTSLRNALSLFGAHEVNICGPDTPAAAIVSQAAATTVPLGENHLLYKVFV